VFGSWRARYGFIGYFFRGDAAVSELLTLREGTLMPGKVYAAFEDVP
jgi:hypothetical protein